MISGLILCKTLQKKKSHRSCMETMGAAGHGLLRCLWAIGASTSLLLSSLSLIVLLTHSIDDSGSDSPTSLPLVC